MAKHHVFRQCFDRDLTKHELTISASLQTLFYLGIASAVVGDVMIALSQCVLLRTRLNDAPRCVQFRNHYEINSVGFPLLCLAMRSRTAQALRVLIAYSFETGCITRYLTSLSRSQTSQLSCPVASPLQRALSW